MVRGTSKYHGNRRSILAVTVSMFPVPGLTRQTVRAKELSSLFSERRRLQISGQRKVRRVYRGDIFQRIYKREKYTLYPVQDRFFN